MGRNCKKKKTWTKQKKYGDVLIALGYIEHTNTTHTHTKQNLDLFCLQRISFAKMKTKRSNKRNVAGCKKWNEYGFSNDGQNSIENDWNPIKARSCCELKGQFNRIRMNCIKIDWM